MEFGLDKCAKGTFKRGKKISAEGIQLNDDKVIQDLEPEVTYTYLGMKEENGTDVHTYACTKCGCDFENSDHIIQIFTGFYTVSYCFYTLFNYK